jgi:hypothetical protein
MHACAAHGQYQAQEQGAKLQSSQILTPTTNAGSLPGELYNLDGHPQIIARCAGIHA